MYLLTGAFVSNDIMKSAGIKPTISAYEENILFRWYSHTRCKGQAELWKELYDKKSVFV